MAEILITGLEMPRTYNNPLCIAIYPDGVIKKDIGEGFLIHTEAKAQKLPPHGVLKDIDVLNDAIIEAERLGEITGGEAGLFKAIITNAPRVIDTTKH